MPIIEEDSECWGGGAMHFEPGWPWFHSEGGLVVIAIGLPELGIV